MRLAAVLLIPATRQYFDLDFPRLTILLAATGIVAIAIGAVELGDRAASVVSARLGRAQR